MPKAIETKQTKDGFAIRIQQRGKAFDVIRCTGFCWKYVEKAVSEDRARNTFALLTMH